MQIIVGSTNPFKVTAVKEIVPMYPMLAEARVESVETISGVPSQPMTIEQTVTGAVNRAVKAFRHGATFSFGIESGLMEVWRAKTYLMNICACAIYDGKDYYLGLSSGFEYPPNVIRIMREKGLEIKDAIREAGLTDNKNVGSTGGVIAILTKGRITRTDYTKQAIMMAMIHLENSELYKQRPAE